MTRAPGISRQAAFEKEHIVVRGSDKGRIITRMMVDNVENGNVMENVSILGLNGVGEHHQDPPGLLNPKGCNLDLMDDGDSGDEEQDESALGDDFENAF
ncbi:hypothetical protein PTKIN_Ptkin02bG0144200 [Pterospermum kingtungense]